MLISYEENMLSTWENKRLNCTLDMEEISIAQ